MNNSVFDRSPDFDLARFNHPPAIDRGAPFWAWNGRLKEDRLHDQLETFKAMGLGGAHIHPRTGLETEYLGKDFMDHVDSCAKKSDELGLLTWLYDEDRWPSGFAGGLAVQDKAYWTRHLRVTRNVIEKDAILKAPIHHGGPQPTQDRTWVASWALQFEDGLLKQWRRLSAERDPVNAQEVSYHAYIEIPPAWSWFNHQQYVDTLNPKAMAKFIEVTHETYYKKFGDRFGKSMPAIFTDEPLFRNNTRPKHSEDPSDHFIAWTDDLSDTYQKTYGEDLYDIFPSVLFNTSNESHREARWKFHNHHTDRFSQAYAGQIGVWCDKHNIALTGHMMGEESLASQTNWTGEAMRSLQHFQLPGIDMLCDGVELLTAKQAQSIARQTGAPGVMSELYGVTNWDFPFHGHKRQGDWQAALGITTRVHHLSWYQMGGEAKRDYPASFGSHVPWAEEYPVIENHFSRLTAALRSGKARCRVALVHPIESYWMVMGPNSDAMMRETMDDGLRNILHWLLEGLIDVDLISEATLERLSPMEQNKQFTVGAMAYDVVLVPPCITLRGSTLKRLSSFTAHGGTVISLGVQPNRVDGKLKNIEDLQQWVLCPLERQPLFDVLQPWTEISLLDGNGNRTPEVISQQRELPNGDRILFVCNFSKNRSHQNLKLKIVGEWQVTELNTLSGEFSDIAFSVQKKQTVLNLQMPIAGHVLIYLKAGEIKSIQPVSTSFREDSRLMGGAIPITLQEDNVLLLDRAEWKLDDGDWNPNEEVLRLDNLARKKLGMPERNGNVAQPWVEAKTRGSHRITLKYKINVGHPTSATRLALEDLDRATITLDDQILSKAKIGTWIDMAFECVAIPPMACGEHILEISWAFGGSEGLECAYICGDFGVWVTGSTAKIGAPVRELYWGNAAVQGLAFYGGNIVYHTQVELPEAATLAVDHFAGALVAVESEGERWGVIYREPWQLHCVESGSKKLDLICFGNRFNTFGQIHNVAKDFRWWGPESWRTKEADWSDEYALKAVGILVAPRVLV